MFFGRYHHLTLPYRVSVTTMAVCDDIVVMRAFYFLIGHDGAAYRSGNAYTSGEPDFTSGFYRG